MTYFGHQNLVGGKTHYGYVAGILSLCSTGPRLPGDPVHAQSFNFPVVHAVVEDVTIGDLIALDPTNLDKIINVAQQLEKKGVRFIATSCGLFAPFQHEIAEHLSIPFLSSALQLVAPLKGFMPPDKKVALFTGHSEILTDKHLRYSGFTLREVVVKGMQDYPEFARIVIEGGRDMNPTKFRQDTINAAMSLKDTNENIGLAVLECPNLITFKNEIQQVLNVPVFDMANLVNFFASGYELKTYSSRYI